MRAKALKVFIIAIILLLSVTAGPVTGQVVSVGEKAPAFIIYAGKKKTLSSSELYGRTIILTYESKEEIDKNKFFKDQILKTFLEHSQEQTPVTIIAVISCFEYFWPIKRYCIAEVQKNAGNLNMNLYDDRTGSMLNDFGLKENESNILIIDSQGIVRYVHSGKISGSETAEVIAIVQSLCRKNLPLEQDSLPRR